MITCKRATEIISAQSDGRASWAEWLALLIHFSVCSPCRLFKRQLRALRELVRAESANNAQSLPESTKSRIKAEIRRRSES